MILTACLVALQSVSPASSSFAPTERLDLELEAVREARESGLAWLAAQQLEDGSWDVSEGEQVHRVGVTALALRALQAAGNEVFVGPHARVMQRGLHWLREQQDPDTGKVGAIVSHTHAYSHAIATLVLVEALNEDSTDAQRASATRAIGYVIRSRNPYGAWRYDSPPHRRQRHFDHELDGARARRGARS